MTVIQTKTVHYTIRFVAGNLAGIVHDCSVKYPESSIPRFEEEMKTLIETSQVIDVLGSPYVILNYHIV